MESEAPAIGVLADDLTGALASAGLLAEAGMRPVVQWQRHAPVPGTTALVADMRTRDYGSDPGQRAGSWAAFLSSLGCRRLELRIDSTLRGAPAAELAGTLAAVGPLDPLVLAVPAFPSAGRTVVDGRIVSAALRRPVAVAPALFGDTAAEPLGIDVIDRGCDEVVRRLRQSGATRFVADSSTETHLRTLAAAVDVLAADERGLLTVSPGAWLRYHRSPPQHRYVLVVLSSDTSTNHEQLAELRLRRSAVVMHAQQLLAGDIVPDWAAVRSGTDVVVVETISRHATDPAVAWLQSTVAARAAGLLLADGRRHGFGCAGIVVGGGQTASALMDTLQSTHVAAQGEVAPLCPRGTLGGGEWAGLPVITKGGLVGDRNTLAGLVDVLRREKP